MVNFTEAITYPPQLIIRHTALRLFRYNDYLAVNRAKLLSYVVEVDVWLGEHYNFFGCWCAILGDPPPYYGVLLTHSEVGESGVLAG